MTRYTSPTRWQREMVVQGWRLISVSGMREPLGLTFHAPEGVWTVANEATGQPPMSASEKATAVLIRDGKVQETKHGTAKKVCRAINPAFRVRTRG